MGRTTPDPLTSPSPTLTLAHGAGDTASAIESIRVPGYEIQGELGRGGMGVVYLARQTALQRLVALKMILAGGHASAADSARFVREAQAVAQLQHPNIVQLYEIGEHDGRPYFALEHCGGGSLAARLKGTPLSPREAAALAETLARAVHAAHRHRIVHRDLKPANVLLTDDGTPKISDFGLAKRLDEAGQTQTGAIVGTPSYMAPEQAEGKKDVGPAADVYALGAILYELLTGRAPFKAETPLETLRQVIADDPVSPTRLQPTVPRDLETICLKALHKQPERRYAGADELADDLRRFLDGRSIIARPVGVRERMGQWARRRPAAAALLGVSVLAALVLLAGGAWFTARVQHQRDIAREALAAVERAEEDRRRADDARYFDRVHLAHYAWSAGDHALTRSLLDECRPELRGWEWNYLDRLTRIEHIRFDGHDRIVGGLALSPDGRTLLSSSDDGTLRVWDAATGRERQVLREHKGYVLSVAFARDGRRFASAATDGKVIVWDTDTLRPVHTLADIRPGPNTVAFHPARPDLLATAQGAWPHFDKPGVVTLWDLRTGQAVRSLMGHTAFVTSVAFTADGRVVSGCHDNRVRVYDAADGRQLAAIACEGPVIRVAVHPTDPNVVAATVGNYNDLTVTGGLHVCDLAAGTSKVLWRSSEPALAVAYRPDGQELLFSTGTVGMLASGGPVRFLDPRTGDELRELRGHVGTARQLVLSGDGRYLFTAGGTRDRGTIVRWPLAGCGDVQTLRPHQDKLWRVLIARDGSRLITSAQDGWVRAWDGATGRLRRELDTFGSTPMTALSPDGRTVAAGTGRGELVLWDTVDGRELWRRQERKEATWDVAFAPDGRTLLGAGQDGRVNRWDVATGERLGELGPHAAGLVHRAEGTRGQGVPAAAFSPDGATVATAVGHLWTPSGPGLVTLWDAATGKEKVTFEGSPRGVSQLVFSPDGTLLAAACKDATVALFDAATGAERARMRGHVSSVFCVAFSPDGTRLASGAEGQQVKVWDVATGKETISFPHRSVVHAVAFSPDGQRLFAGAADGSLRIWEIARKAEP